MGTARPRQRDYLECFPKRRGSRRSKPIDKKMGADTPLCVAKSRRRASCEPERQRRSIIQPRVARRSYPGFSTREVLNPERVVASLPGGDVGAFGCNPFRVVPSPLRPRVAPAAQPWADGLERRWRSPKPRGATTPFSTGRSCRRVIRSPQNGYGPEHGHGAGFGHAERVNRRSAGASGSDA
jgi:hypothetical protein